MPKHSNSSCSRTRSPSMAASFVAFAAGRVSDGAVPLVGRCRIAKVRQDPAQHVPAWLPLRERMVGVRNHLQADAAVAKRAPRGELRAGEQDVAAGVAFRNEERE